MALHNFTRNLHIVLDFLVLKIEEDKNLSLGKTVLILWLQICEKIAYFVGKITLEKKCKKVQTQKKLSNFMDKLSHLFKI